jgi:thioredoxin-like negative regulator of GroEL
MAVIEIDGENFQEVLQEHLETYRVVILKFESQYCDGCIALGFELEELEESDEENIAILEIDCADNELVAQLYNVTRVPAMAIYKNKELIYNGAGVILAADILEMIKE